MNTINQIVTCVILLLSTMVSIFQSESFVMLKKALIEYDNEILKEDPDWWKKESNYKRNT